MENSLAEALKAYFDNEVKIDGQLEAISRVGRGNAGIAESYLRSAQSPITGKGAEQLESLFEYSRKEAALEPMLLERDRLSRLINSALKRIPNKKILYTRKVTHIMPPEVKNVVVALWSDGTKLFIEEYKG